MSIAIFKNHIAQFPAPVQKRLNTLAQVLQDLMPEAEPCISYQMPAFRLKKKIVVYFAGFKNHIGFYPTAKPIAAFAPKLEGYKWAKGSVQFQHDQDLPLVLIKEMTVFRLKDFQ
jgi:uncharacterized protein YdhG (YjbR/CyaY superfamily)